MATLGSVGAGSLPSLFVFVRRRATRRAGSREVGMRWNGMLCGGTSLVLVACGGSGGGGGGGDFEGTYATVTIVGRSETSLEVDVAWGTTVTTGDSSADTTSTQNSSGTVGPGDSGPIGFVVEEDGALSLDDGTTPFARGCLAEDGRLGLVATDVPAFLPLVTAMVRVSPRDASDADLSGSWHVIGYGATTTDPFSNVMTFDFDGTGSWSLVAGTHNTSGTILPLAPFGPSPYSVASDGSLLLTSGAPSFTGAVLEGSDFFVVGGGSTTGSSPQVLAGVRVSMGAGDGAFDGTYCIVGIEFDGGLAHVFRSFSGTAVADGAGAVAFSGNTNAEGVVVAEAPFADTSSTTYAVAANGTLTVPTNVGTMQGAVSEDGRFALIGGGVSPGSRTAFYLLVRL
jgi:hypothetical protein